MQCVVLYAAALLYEVRMHFKLNILFVSFWEFKLLFVIINTVLANTAVFYYKNNICLYKMLHVSTFLFIHAW
jgi:hypothetical protein